MNTVRLGKQLLMLGGAILAIILLPLTVIAIDISQGDQGMSLDEVTAAPLTTMSPESKVEQTSATLAQTSVGFLPVYDSLSPAEALTNGRPTLFYFQPYELCQIRYCRQPANIAGQVQARYQDQVNFVTVAAYALPDYKGAEPYPQTALRQLGSLSNPTLFRLVAPAGHDRVWA